MPKGESTSSGSNDLDIDEMVKLMNYRLNSLNKSSGKVNKPCNIPRVQELIRKVDPSAFEPIILAIGPYHHGSSSLQALEREKWNCLDYLLKVNRERKLEDYLTFIKDFEDDARTCYSDDINMEQGKFLQMLLLDGCFIVQYFNALDGLLPSTSDIKICCDDTPYFITERMVKENNDDSSTSGEQCIMTNVIGKQKSPVPMCSSLVGTCRETTLIIEEVKSSQNSNEQIGNWYHCCVGHDLLLLENQLPFFIVRGIYELVAGNRRPFSFLTDQIALYVEDFMKYYPISIQKEHRPNNFYHILHLFHMYTRPSIKHIKDHQCLRKKGPFYSLAYLVHRYLKTGSKLADGYHKNVSQDTWKDCSQQRRLLISCRRATEYHQTGVKFKKKLFDKDNPHSLLDIKFQNGILEVPYLFIDQSTVSSFRNLIAFEQTCPQLGNDVTAYAVFLSFLVSTPDDVAFLAHKGIMVHQLCSDGEVSAIFAKLGKNADFDLNGSYFLKRVCQELEKHYHSRINRWMAWLWQNHFSNPWLSIAVVAAAIVLFCTVLQTLLALLVYLQTTNGA